MELPTLPAVRPFLDRTSTTAKMGKRGLMEVAEQRETCENVYPYEADGTAQWWADQTGRVVYTATRTSGPNGRDRPALLPSYA